MNDDAWKAIESRNWWRGKPDTGIRRELVEKEWNLMQGAEPVYFYGPRRAGKTTACLQILEKLSKKDGKTSCLYINFEEPAFASMLKPEFISEALEEHANVHGKPPLYVFLDEVQNVPGWEKWVRVAADKKMPKVFVTGSSAKLLSSEFATSLGGRGLGFLVLPFSWPEFKKARPAAGFEDYLQTGGYPAVALEKSEEKRARLLEEYFETAISKDIAARYKVHDVPSLRTLAVWVLTNSTKPLSYNTVRSLTGLSFDSVRLYLSYLEDAFLAFQVPAFSYSLKQAMEKPRKYYAYDTGLAAAVSKSFSPDFGRKAENAVAIELVRRHYEPQYHRNGADVDFVVKDGLALTGVNVCWEDKAPARETQSLSEFVKIHKKAQTELLAGRERIADWMEKPQRT